MGSQGNLGPFFVVPSLGPWRGDVRICAREGGFEDTESEFASARGNPQEG
jgi:hypothetical protein